MFQFEVEGLPVQPATGGSSTPVAVGGFYLRPVQALQITSRLSYRRSASETTQADDDNEAGAYASHEREDSCEDLPNFVVCKG